MNRRERRELLAEVRRGDMLRALSVTARAQGFLIRQNEDRRDVTVRHRDGDQVPLTREALAIQSQGPAVFDLIESMKRLQAALLEDLARVEPTTDRRDR